MKHWKTVRVVALAVLGACTLLGQTASTGKTFMPGTPAQTAARMVTRLTTLLDLTAAQQTAATTIFTTEFTALQPIQSNLQSARKTLTADIQANNTSGISTGAQTIGNLTQQSVETTATADAAFYALLTGAQQTKFNAMKLQGLDGLGGPRGAGRIGGPRR
jgi:Spy/CpxP family protein refolding chaperone